MKKQMHRLLSLIFSLVLVVGLIPGTMTAYAAGTCPHTNVDWHKSSSGDEEHFKICTNRDCDDRNGSIVERGLHTDTNADGNCDDCSVELINVTFDYEDPAKTDKVVLFAKGAVARDYNAYIADWDEKDGYVADKWELSSEKTLAASLSQDGIGQTIMVGDAVYTTHWHKVYEEIHFSFTGYEIGANISDGVLTDDIDGYAPLDFLEIWGGKNFAIVADKDGIPDMTDPSTMLKVVTGAFEENKDYWLAVMIGGEGRNITGDINVEAYGIDDYFLDSPDCVDKYRVAEGEAEIAFFKLKPLSGSMPTTYTVFFDSNGGTGTMADVTGISGEYTLPPNGFTAPDGKQFKAWSVGGAEKAVGDKITVTANTTVTAVWEGIPAGHTCDIKPVVKDEPSCTEGGKEAYYKCEGCGKFYEDALGAKEITDLAAWGNLPKNGHTESDWKSDKDNHWKECTVTACGFIIENSKAAHKDENKDGKCDVCEYNVGTPTTPTEPSKPSDNPQTGDNSNMILWISLLMLSALGVVATTILGKKKYSVK